MCVDNKDIVKIWIDGECYEQCFEADKRAFTNFCDSGETFSNQVRLKLDDKTIEIDKDVFESYEPYSLYKSLKDSIALGVPIWQFLTSIDEKYTSIYKKDGIVYLCEDEKTVAKFGDSGDIFKNLEEGRVYSIFREEFTVIDK